jgi:phage/plasmid-associated DNA primase
MKVRRTTSTTETQREYRRRSDSVADYVGDRCVLSPEDFVNKAEWYGRYKSWCENSGGKPVGRTTAYRRLLSLDGISEDKIAGGERIFRGINLKRGPNNE